MHRGKAAAFEKSLSVSLAPFVGRGGYEIDEWFDPDTLGLSPERSELAIVHIERGRAVHGGGEIHRNTRDVSKNLISMEYASAIPSQEGKQRNSKSFVHSIDSYLYESCKYLNIAHNNTYSILS